MPGESDILEALPEVLGRLINTTGSGDALSRATDGPGDDFVLRIGKYLFVIEAKSSADAAHVNQAIEALQAAKKRVQRKTIPLVAVPFMGETGRRICQDKEVGFVDLCGNAHIEAPGLVVHVEGRPNKFVRRGRPASLFAPRSSRVSRILLRDPQTWWQQQELAKESGLGKGYVSRIVRRLEEDHLIVRDEKQRVRPNKAEVLLDAWRLEYAFDKHDAMIGHVTARTGEELTRKTAAVLEHHPMRYAVTGLAGAALLAPFAAYRRVTIFVEGKIHDELLQSLKFRPEERGANLWLVRPKDGSVFWDSRLIDGIHSASPLQIYLDLKDMPERAEEAAEHLRSVHLNWSKDG